MRSILTTAMVAAGAVVLVVATTALGDTGLNIWRVYGDRFQLGYVVGYLEAVRLAQRRDPRALIPAKGKNFDRWLEDVNAYFEDPAHANSTVPDAMGFVGNQIRKEQMGAWSKRNKGVGPSPSPSPGS